jgi:uncharacterized membrane protein
MKNKIDFFKTILLGGIVFLLPLVLFVTVVGKGIQIMMMITEPLNQLFPMDSIGGIALVNLIAIWAVLFSCFLAGFLAKSVLGKKLFQSIDNKLLIFPGYSLFKARLTGNIGSELKSQSLNPVLVHLGPKSQIGFSIEKLSAKRLAVFMPGAPDPWTGSVIIVKEEQVETLSSDMKETMQIFESLGRGSADLLG